MILRFQKPDGGELAVGPAPWFRVAGNFIRQGPNGEIVGTFRNHHWEVQSERCVVIRCRDTVQIHFEDLFGGRTETFGPTNSFVSRDGVLFIDNEPFAKFIEETQLWRCHPTETFWQSLVVADAPPAGDP